MTKLAPELERYIISGMMAGAVSPNYVSQEELSNEGKAVCALVKNFLRNGARVPITAESIWRTGPGLCGTDRDSLVNYLRSLPSIGSPEEVRAIAKVAKDKTVLVKLVNEAGGQLARGRLSLDGIYRILDNVASEGSDALVPLSTLKDLQPPKGVEMRSLPKLTAATGGFHGVWVIGAIPKLGKSTLAWQIALEVGQTMSVLYYDLDGMGAVWFKARTEQIVSGDAARYEAATRQVYLRQSIRSLHQDLQHVSAPALIVVDMFQTLPKAKNLGRESLDNWASQFKGLAGKGYAVILVSEVPREKYNIIGMDVFKETGELEYAGSVLLQLAPGAGELVQAHIVAQRHHPTHGHICDLERDPKRVWWFRESSLLNENFNLGGLS